MSFSDSVLQICKEVYRVSQEAASADVFLHAVRSFPANTVPSILDALEPPVPGASTQEANSPDFLAQGREFCLYTGVQQCVDQIVAEITPNPAQSGTERATEASETVPAEPEATFLHLFACLDLVLNLAPTHEILKRQFFLILEAASDQLVRTDHLAAARFWTYLETRAELFKEHVFSSANTANRIAVLGLCNHVTDFYYERNANAKYDSYKKDSFNDKFHARVRVFLANLLDFEDSTGLNKYFATSNRENHMPRFAAAGAKSGDDQLLDDILQFQRMLRNPLQFLRSPRDLAVQVDSLSKLNSYLLSEETKYAKVHPTRDIFKVQHQNGKTVEPELRCFFPESYWMSAFEDQPVSADDAASDKRFGSANLDASKYRKLVIVQIFLACNFFIELSSSKKKDLLARIGAKANTRHITEDSVPEHLAVKLTKIKNDTLKSVRGWDTQLSFLLLSLAESEDYWLGWLIYAKKKDGSGPLLDSHRNISASKIATVQEQFETAFKFKTKRYFNSHVTPQLSRRMKTKTGLEGLRIPDLPDDYTEQIQELARRIDAESDAQIKTSLNEERIILVWKSVRGLRNIDWLDLDKALRMKDIEEEQKDEVPEVESAAAQSERKDSANPTVTSKGAIETSKSSEEASDSSRATENAQDATENAERPEEAAKKFSESAQEVTENTDEDIEKADKATETAAVSKDTGSKPEESTSSENGSDAGLSAVTDAESTDTAMTSESKRRASDSEEPEPAHKVQKTTS